MRSPSVSRSRVFARLSPSPARVCRWVAAGLGALAVLVHASAVFAQERLRDALRDFTPGEEWVYDRWDEARSAAERRGKPIFAVFRCVP